MASACTGGPCYSGLHRSNSQSLCLTCNAMCWPTHVVPSSFISPKSHIQCPHNQHWATVFTLAMVRGVPSGSDLKDAEKPYACDFPIWGLWKIAPVLHGALCFIHESAERLKGLPEQHQGECGYFQTDGPRGVGGSESINNSPQ